MSAGGASRSISVRTTSVRTARSSSRRCAAARSAGRVLPGRGWPRAGRGSRCRAPRRSACTVASPQPQAVRVAVVGAARSWRRAYRSRSSVAGRIDAAGSRPCDRLAAGRVPGMADAAGPRRRRRRAAPRPGRHRVGQRQRGGDRRRGRGGPAAVRPPEVIRDGNVVRGPDRAGPGRAGGHRRAPGHRADRRQPAVLGDRGRRPDADLGPRRLRHEGRGGGPAVRRGPADGAEPGRHLGLLRQRGGRGGAQRAEPARPASIPSSWPADFAVLCEPTNARIEGGCQGTMRVEVELTGVAAHSARSWMGHNAIHDAGAVLQRLAGVRAASRSRSTG